MKRVKKEGTSVVWAPSKKRFILSFASPTGWIQKAIPRDVTTQRAADAWATEYLATLGAKPAESLTTRREEGMSVAECAKKWIPIRKLDPKVSPSTLGNNKSHLKRWILPKFGELAIAAVDVPQIRVWIREVRALRGPQTVRNIYYTASTLYADAMAEGWVKREANPFAHPGVVKELPELNEADPVDFPLATVQGLIDATPVPLERRARYALAFMSGQRDGEVAGLHLSDLERKAPIPLFRIEAAVALVGMTGHATPNKTKTRGSKRTIPFHPASLAAVNEWIEVGLPALLGRKPTPEDYLFPNADGGPTRPRSAELIREDLEAAGLPTTIRGMPVDFKDTRSSFATWLAEAGVPDPIRARLMGHRVKGVTERHYTVRDLPALAEAVARIPLVWTRGTVPIVVPVGTETEPNPLALKAPPARIGRATFGLGSGTGVRLDCAEEGDLPSPDRSTSASDIGLAGHIGSDFCADTVPEGPASEAIPVAALVAESAYFGVTSSVFGALEAAELDGSALGLAP